MPGVGRGHAGDLLSLAGSSHCWRPAKRQALGQRLHLVYPLQVSPEVAVAISTLYVKHVQMVMPRRGPSPGSAAVLTGFGTHPVFLSKLLYPSPIDPWIPPSAECPADVGAPVPELTCTPSCMWHGPVTRGGPGRHLRPVTAAADLRSRSLGTAGQSLGMLFGWNDTFPPARTVRRRWPRIHSSGTLMDIYITQRVWIHSEEYRAGHSRWHSADGPLVRLLHNGLGTAPQGCCRRA